VNANLGLATRRAAEATGDRSQRRQLLEESSAAYHRAASRAPNVARYASDLAEVTTMLANS
jgi:hypothetical protein